MRSFRKVEKQDAQNQVERQKLHALKPIGFTVTVDLKNQMDSDEWHEDKGGLRWFRALSAKGSWDRLKQEGLTDVTHLGEEHFKFSVLSNGPVERVQLAGPIRQR